MKLKLGNMNAKEISKGVCKICIIYVVILLLHSLSGFLFNITSGNRIVEKVDYIIHLIHMLSIPILSICLIKLVCEVLYKVLRFIEVIIGKNTNKSNE